MTHSTQLTVVIPTRERADTLLHTIRTCVAQSYPNVTFLICDNASTDNTRQVVESFSDPRIRYANIGRRVEMSDNWEFGLQHLAEGYVTFVGDDDGLLWESMAMAAQIIGETSTPVLVWNKVQYHWPDHIVPEQRNHLQLSLSRNIEVLKSKEMMQKLRRYEIGYDTLPCLYNAFVSVPLLHHIRELSGGKFFHCVSPDLYSSVALAAFVPQYLRCSFALTINGASRHSIGTAGILKRNDQSPAQKFENELATRFHPLVPQAPLQSFCITDALLQAQTFLPGKSDFYQVDYNEAARSAAEQMRTWNPTAYKNGLELLREFGRRNNIEAYVEQLIASAPNQPADPADIRRNDGFNPDNQLLTMDSSLLGIENVYDAGLISSYLMRQLNHQQLSELWSARRQPLNSPAMAQQEAVTPLSENLMESISAL